MGSALCTIDCKIDFVSSLFEYRQRTYNTRLVRILVARKRYAEIFILHFDSLHAISWTFCESSATTVRPLRFLSTLVRLQHSTLHARCAPQLFLIFSFLFFFILILCILTLLDSCEYFDGFKMVKKIEECGECNLQGGICVFVRLCNL